MKVPIAVSGAITLILLAGPHLVAQQMPAPSEDSGPVLSPAFQQDSPIQPQGYLKKPTPYHYLQPPADDSAAKPQQNQQLPLSQPAPKQPAHSASHPQQAHANPKPSQNLQASKPAIAPPSSEIAQVDPADPQTPDSQPPSAYQYPQPGYSNPRPPSGFQDPQSGYPQSQPQYSQPQPGYAPPQPGYAPPAPGYAQPGYAAQGPQDYGEDQPNYAPAQPLDPQQLEQLVAPIALYPDALVAQILAASTYPAQISAADQWVRQMGYASPDQIAAGANAQTSWDPSIKALTACPQVLQMLDGNLQWTTALGNAYYNQPQDVMNTIQVLRERAEQAGTLQNTPQEQVTQNQGYIALAPANPDVLYVPTYNPWAVYGAPIAPYPGFSFFGALGSFAGFGMRFGLGFGIGAFEHTPFGMLAWGLDWLANAILFHHDHYFTHSASVRDWGLPHGGPRAFHGGQERARFGGEGYHHEALPIHAGQGLNRAESFARREGSFDGRNQNPIHGYPGGGNVRSALPGPQAYNRMPEARPQQFAQRPQTFAARPEAYGSQQYAQNRPQQFAQNAPRSYGYGAVRPGESYGARPGMGYAPQPYRAPTPNFAHGNAYQRPGNAYAGNYGRQEREGALGGGRAPRSYNYGGHSSRGFSEKAPKMGHSGGGHFGGGHSGGGHSGSGHHHFL